MPNEQRVSGGLMIHVISGLHGGGAERLLTAIAFGSLAAAQKILVVSLLPGGEFRPCLEAAGIAVCDLGMRRRVPSLAGLLRFVALLRAQRPAIVQGWMYHANLLACIGLMLSGRWSRTFLYWGLYCTAMTSGERRWRLRLVIWLSARLSGLTAGIFYNAVSARDYHRSIGFHEPHSLILRNAVDTRLFGIHPELRAQVRRELRIAEDAMVVVSAARVDAMKDWRTLMAAVRPLDNLVTLAVGKGTESLPDQSGFIRLGWRYDLHRIFNAADIFVLASAFGEGRSLAMTEAMACGLPVVTTDVGDHALLSAGAGVAVPPRDAGALTEEIRRLAADPALRRRWGEAARARVIEDHSLERSYESFRRGHAGAMANE
jgi:glycosyltransferase involved in cell wall biosynthesis